MIKCVCKVKQTVGNLNLRRGTNVELLFVGTLGRNNFIEKSSAKARSWDQ